MGYYTKDVHILTLHATEVIFYKPYTERLGPEQTTHLQFNLGTTLTSPDEWNIIFYRVGESVAPDQLHSEDLSYYLACQEYIVFVKVWRLLAL